MRDPIYTPGSKYWTESNINLLGYFQVRTIRMQQLKEIKKVSTISMGGQKWEQAEEHGRGRWMDGRQ